MVNPRTENLKSEGLTQADFDFQVWNFQPHREFPWNLDSEILTLQIDRSRALRARCTWSWSRAKGIPYEDAWLPLYRMLRSIRKLGISELIFSGEFPMDLGIPPLEIWNMVEISPLQSRFSVCGLTVCHVNIAPRYGIVSYRIVSYRIVWIERIVAWYRMAWHGMAWHGMAWHGMAWYGMVWYGMVWYGMVWYGVVIGAETVPTHLSGNTDPRTGLEGRQKSSIRAPGCQESTS